MRASCSCRRIRMGSGRLAGAAGAGKRLCVANNKPHPRRFFTFLGPALSNTQNPAFFTGLAPRHCTLYSILRTLDTRGAKHSPPFVPGRFCICAVGIVRVHSPRIPEKGIRHSLSPGWASSSPLSLSSAQSPPPRLNPTPRPSTQHSHQRPRLPPARSERSAPHAARLRLVSTPTTVAQTRPPPGGAQ